MKRYRVAIVLLAVLVLMLGAYYCLTRVVGVGTSVEGNAGTGYGEDSGTPVGASGDAMVKTEEAIGLVDRAVSDITAFTVNYKGELFEAKKEASDTSGSAEADVWRLINRDGFNASKSKLSAAASGFCSLNATKLVAESAVTEAEFGFGVGDTAVISGVFSDGGAVTLEIGMKNPTGDGYYVRKLGMSEIYLCSAFSVEQLLLTEFMLIDTGIMAFEEGDIEGITLLREDAELFSARQKEDAAWEMYSPITAALDGTSKAQLLGSIQNLSALEFLIMGAEDTDLAAYGLNSPRYVLTVTPKAVKDESYDGSAGVSAVKPVSLFIGNEAGSRSEAYGMIAGSSDVFTFSLSSFGWLDKPLKEFVNSFVYIVNINDISGLSADFDGISAEAQITTDEENSENDVFILNGIDVSKLTDDKNDSLFRAFYQSMIGVMLYDIEAEGKPSGDAEVTFTYRLKDSGAVMVVEFVPKDDRLYYVLRNSEYTGLLVEKRVFEAPNDGLLAKYAALTDAMA